mgnify:CR=1 FL=1
MTADPLSLSGMTRYGHGDGDAVRTIQRPDKGAPTIRLADKGALPTIRLATIVGLLATAALLGVVLSRQGESLISALHDATLVGAGLALLSALTAFATLGGVRVRPSRGKG